MKKYIWPLLLTACIATFSYCNSAKKATTTVATPTVFYDTDVRSLVETKCTPCHIPAKGGRKLALDTYESASTNIDDIVRRVQLNPEDKGFMPFKHPKLTDAEINVFKNWKAEGMTKSK